MTLDRGSRAAVAREVRLYQQWLLRRLDARAAVTRSAADLGCGNGDWTVVLARRAEQLLAVDFSASFLQFTVERVRAAAPGCTVRAELGDLATIVLPDQLDLVVAGAITQYLDDDEVERLFAAIAAALRPGGLFYFRSTVCQRGERFTRDEESFQGVYRSATWYRKALVSAGFTIEDSATATTFVAHEWAHAYLRGVARPLRLPLGHLVAGVRRLYRAFKRTDVLVCLVRVPS